MPCMAHQLAGCAGNQYATAVHVEDAARAYVLALERGKAGNIYNITSNWDLTNKCAPRPLLRHCAAFPLCWFWIYSNAAWVACSEQ